jgi:prepilin-type N-terminal cleavage/methylation domain-containing protein
VNATGSTPTGPRRSGFTLIELLVVVAIIAVLAGLLLPAMSKAKSQAKKANEMSSSHQLMLAWQMYADDHNDRVLPGYRHGFEALDMDGHPVPFPINARYPWRLYPYLGKSFQVIYANENRPLLQQFQRMEDKSIGIYAASVFPSLGINSTFVGGDDNELAPEGKAREVFGDFCVLKTTDTRRPSELMVFASSRGPFEGKIVNGFYLVRSPFFMARRWSQDFNEADGPEAWGHVHPRFSNRALGGLVDGHVEALSKRELQDMRHWANQADRADWSLQRPAR